MIYPLEFKDYRRVSSLFEGQHLGLHIDAVVAGNSPGIIWVDDTSDPRHAYMWDKGHCHYFVGESDDARFNKSLREFLNDEIFPQMRKKGFQVLKAYYTNAWEGAIETILEGVNAEKRKRIFHRYTRSNVPLSNSPSGFSLCRIDRILLESSSKHVDYVRGEIASCWNSLELFMQNGFGFCLQHCDSIVGWCTGEYMSDRVCGIGIEVLEEFQKRGLATVVAQAFVGHCLSMGITPHWDSWGDNVASLRVAEKVGFEMVLDYSVLYCSFD